MGRGDLARPLVIKAKAKKKKKILLPTFFLLFVLHKFVFRPYLLKQFTIEFKI